MFWHALAHIALKYVARIFQFFIFGVVPALLLWLHFIGLPSSFYPAIIDAARVEGISLNFSRVRLSIINGFILEKVRLKAIQSLENPDISIDYAKISINWRKLLHGQVELTALDLFGAQLYLPVVSNDGITRTLRLTKIRARLLLSDGVVSVPLAHFYLQNIRVIATGQILPGDKDTSSPDNFLLPPEVSKTLEILETLDFGSHDPTLEFDFAARAGDPSALRLSQIHFEANKIARGNISLNNVRLDASYNDRIIQVENFSARDKLGGSLSILGQWDTRTGEADAEIECSLDPAPWLAELLPDSPWSQFSATTPPTIHTALQFRTKSSPKLSIRGSLASGPLQLRDVLFNKLTGDFSWQDGNLYISGLRVLLPTGSIEADLMTKPDQVQLRLDCNADPLPLVAFLDKKAREDFLKLELKFIDPPHITINATGTKLDPKYINAQGSLKLGRTSIHNSTMDSARADLSFNDLALKFSNLFAKRPEGSGSGSFTYDFKNMQVRLDNLQSTMNPENVLLWADPDIAKEVKPYRFNAPPHATVNGVVWLKAPDKTTITANFVAPKGLDYDLLDRTLNITEAAGNLKFTGRNIAVNIPTAKLFGGNAKVTAKINTAHPNARQFVNAELDRVNFETLTRLYFNYKNSKGEISGHYNFSFVANDAWQMQGKGHMEVRNGNVFAFPVLGPLSLLLDAIIPGTGYQTSRKATCDFDVSNGKIYIPNLDVIGTGFTMIGQGSLYFIEDRMDFAVRVNAQGIPGIILYPVSKLMEYVSDGKLSEPVWRPRVLPKSPLKPLKIPLPIPKRKGSGKENNSAKS